MRRWSALFASALVLAPAHALAFDTFESFGAEILPPGPYDPLDPSTRPGGGGGRYFTGSIADGLTCNSCHFGGGLPEDVGLTIDPDPREDGYRSGEQYVIEIELPGVDAGPNAASIELSDLTGRSAGTLELVPASALQAADQCNPVDPENPFAAHIVDLENPTRQVAGVDACGAQRLRVTWTAPETATGAVWLNAGIVVADVPEQFQDPSGDYATIYAFMIPAFGQTVEAGRTESACATAPGSSPGSPLALLALAGLALVLRRRR